MITVSPADTLLPAVHISDASYLHGLGHLQFQVVDAALDFRLGRTDAVITLVVDMPRRTTLACDLRFAIECTDRLKKFDGLRAFNGFVKALGLAAANDTDDLIGRSAALHVRVDAPPTFARLAA